MCAVVGVPDPKWGEVGLACVVLKSGTAVSAEELVAFMQDHLARYKVPKRVAFLDAPPISAAGKILKRELREWNWKITSAFSHLTISASRERESASRRCWMTTSTVDAYLARWRAYCDSAWEEWQRNSAPFVQEMRSRLQRAREQVLAEKGLEYYVC